MEVGAQIWLGAQNTARGKIWYAASVPADVPPDQATAWVMSRAAKLAARRTFVRVSGNLTTLAAKLSVR